MVEKLQKKQKELEDHIAGLYAEAEKAEAKLEFVNEMIDEEVKAKAAMPSEGGSVTIHI